jgi:hypothetical protein
MSRLRELAQAVDRLPGGVAVLADNPADAGSVLGG